MAYLYSNTEYSQEGAMEGTQLRSKTCSNTYPGSSCHVALGKLLGL